MIEVRSAPYTYINFENTVPTPPSKIERVFIATLPFLALYKPLSFPMVLTASSIRFVAELNNDNMLGAAVAAASVAGTVFGHPLGMLISSTHDLLIDLSHLAGSLSNGEYKNAMVELLQSINETLYIALFLGASAEFVVASLCAQFLIGIYHSRAHFQKGENIEGVSHFLMGLIRGHQAIRQYQGILIREEIRKAQEEGKPYLPLANRAQIFFSDIGYRVSSLARWTIRQIGCCLDSNQESASRIQAGVGAFLAIPTVLASFLISTPCYFAASYVGTGRFERIDATCPSNFASADRVHVQFQNICGQNPWSVFTGGYPPPLEVGPDGTRRVDAILEEILQENPDIYCGQEYDDRDTARVIGNRLAQTGRTSILDLGCDDPLFNHSGLFMAVPDAIAGSIGFTPIDPEHTSGITYGCNRGVLTADVPMADGDPLTIANIHLNAGSAPENHLSRLEQLQHYVAPILQGKRALAVGDSNLDTSALPFWQKREIGLNGIANALEGQVTCTDAAKHGGHTIDGCPDCEERIDVALFDPTKVTISDVQLHPGNSDHSQVSLTVATIG